VSRPPEPGATLTRYSGGAIAFHWIIAVLIVANLLGAHWTEDWEGPARATAMALHKATGITVLVLSLSRLVWRVVHRPPPFPASIGRLEAVGARFVHWLFYIMMIAVPVSGWLMISAASPRRPFYWYGGFDLPYLPVEGDKALQVVAHDAHEWLGWLFIGLLFLHIAGALKHHLSDRRGFIGRMLPGRFSAGR
jgi:cytochrome b561